MPRNTIRKARELRKAQQTNPDIIARPPNIAALRRRSVPPTMPSTAANPEPNRRRRHAGQQNLIDLTGGSLRSPPLNGTNPHPNRHRPRPAQRNFVDLTDGSLRSPSPTNLPAIGLQSDQNPFFTVAAAIRSHQRDSDDADAGQLDLDELYPLKPTPLQTAGPAGFFDNSVPSGHENNTSRLMAAALYVRYHNITEIDISHILSTAQRASNSHKKELDHRGVLSWQSTFQTDIMKFYYEGLDLLIKESGSLAAWRLSSREQRMTVFREIWMSDPLQMAKASLGPCACVVPLANNFSDSTPSHQKWQKFHQNVFERTCEYVWEERFARDTDNRQTMFSLWSEMLLQDHWKEMELGGVDNIPVKWGGISDVGRRRKVIKPTRGFGIAPGYAPSSSVRVKVGDAKKPIIID